MAAPSDLLTEILRHKAEEVALRRSLRPLAEVRSAAESAAAPRGFVQALARRIAGGAPAVIAEIKRASPSKGVIRADYQPAAIAAGYEQAGAACLSVLTDERYFQGADAHLQEARAACRLPVLRKDFVLDPYQIYESRALGADCILLIVAALNDAELRSLAELSRALSLDVLVEVHNREELERGLMLRTPLIGINNRDLRTFHTDLETTIRLMVDVFPDRTVVSESGIRSAQDVARLRRHGVHVFLVGESLMAAPDPGAKLQEIFPA
ncbi:MAG: indole-3-glycerol phosphate synthase TrpC [Gammaproteobacteria bacterium]